MAKLEFQNRDTSARYGYRTIGAQEYPDISDAAEAVAALARLLGVTVTADATEVDRERYAKVNPGGRLVRLIIDLR